MSDEMARRDGRARARRARAAGGGDPRGPGRRAGRGDPDHRRGLGRRHGAGAGEARRRACSSAGAIGTDAAGDMLLALLERDGVDTALLAAPRRRPDLGQRPADPPRRRAARVPRGGRQRHLRARRLACGCDRRRPRTCTSAAPSSWAARRPRRSSRAPASTGSSPRPTSSRPASSGLLDWIAPALEHLDYFLPNDEQVLGAHRRGRPRGRLPRAARARRRLRGRDLRRRRRAGRRRRRRASGCPPSRSTSSTPPAAATPSPPASCAASSLGRDRRDAARARLRRRRAGRAGPRHRPRRVRPRRRRGAGRLGRQPLRPAGARGTSGRRRASSSSVTSPAVQVVVLVVEQVHELALAAEHEVRARIASGEVVHRDDGRALPVAAVRETAASPVSSSAHVAPAELRALAPAADQALHPVEQRVRVAPLARRVDLAVAERPVLDERPARLRSAVVKPACGSTTTASATRTL